MNSNKIFIKTSVISVALLTTFVLSAVQLYRYSSLQAYNFILIFLIFLLSIVIFLVILSIFLASSILFINGPNRKANTAVLKFVFWAVRNLLMPILSISVKIFRLNNEQLDKFYIDLNNIMVKLMKNKLKNTELVLLLPHCLQNQSCGIKITYDINNCKRCGKCDIGSLVQLSRKWQIRAIVVTGGTAARAELAKIKPKAAVAVACERDLSSGIKDVGRLPVIGVLNMRPNGPCCNTRVEIDLIEQTIKHFLEGETQDEG